MTARTKRLMMELHALLDGPDECDLLEMIIGAELRATAAVRRVVGPHARELVPPNVVVHFRDLQRMTKETGDVWAARVDRVLHTAGTATQPADPVALAILRPLALQVQQLRS